MNERLPIAEGPEVRRDAAVLLRLYRRPLAVVLLLNAFAAVAGLVGPFLLGELVEAVEEGTTAGYVDRLIGILVVSVIAQTMLTWFARRSSFVLSERVFAHLREDFMRQVLALPLSVVERAGTGDLVSRTTADVDTLARTVRFAIPETLISAVTVLLTVVAAVVVSPVVALSCVVGLPAILIGTRWYLRRAPQGYLWERAAYATMTGTVGETVDGGRTVDALGLGRRRVGRIDGDLADAYQAERRTLYLRTVLFPTVEVAYVLPVAVALVWGGWLVSAGHASIGEVTTVALYVQQLADPVDRLISWLDEIQVGATSFARLVGHHEGSRRPCRRRARSPSTSGCAPRTSATPTSRIATCSTVSTSISSRVSGSPSSARPGRASRRWAGCSPASIRRAPAASRSATSGSSTWSSRRCGRRWRS